MRIGEAPAQLVRVGPPPRCARRACARCAARATATPASASHELVVARHQLARLLQLALPVAAAAPAAAARADSFGSSRSARCEEFRRPPSSCPCAARRRRRRNSDAPASRRAGCARRCRKYLIDSLLAPGLAQEPAVVVVDVGVVRARGSARARNSPAPARSPAVPCTPARTCCTPARSSGRPPSRCAAPRARRHVAARVIQRRELGVDARAVARIGRVSAAVLVSLSGSLTLVAPRASGAPPAQRRRAARRAQRTALASCAHLRDRARVARAARAVGDLAGELAAGGVDVVAARLARGDRDAAALQDLGEAPDALRARAPEAGAAGTG